jgi:hypothetical protein
VSLFEEQPTPLPTPVPGLESGDLGITAFVILIAVVLSAYMLGVLTRNLIAVYLRSRARKRATTRHRHPSED